MNLDLWLLERTNTGRKKGFNAKFIMFLPTFLLQSSIVLASQFISSLLCYFLFILVFYKVLSSLYLRFLSNFYSQFIYRQTPWRRSLKMKTLDPVYYYCESSASKNRKWLDYTFIMSCTKIKRLKTPLKSRQSFKSPGSTVLSLEDLNEQSTISLIKTGTWSESIQSALIAEINKLYKEIASVRQKTRRDDDFIEELSQSKQQLEMKIKDLKAQVAQLKQLYELQFANHQQLRKFYQQRQLQWVLIVTQHRKMLEQYDQVNGTSLSKLQQINLNSQINDFLYQKTKLVQSKMVGHPNPEIDIQRSECKVERKLGSLRSLEKSNTSLQKGRLRGSTRESGEANQLKQLSRHYSQEVKFGLRSKKLSKNLNDETKVKNVHRDLEIDEFFDQIIRKTYYRYKQKCISVGEIENMEDMIKLKNANTSTKERLTKTVKKLNFQIDNENQFKLFCEYVQKAVIERYQTLRGDFVFDLLIEKLKQCEKLALSSDSELYRLDKQKSSVKDSLIAFQARRQIKLTNDLVVSNLALSSKNSSTISKASPKNVQLLVNSTIKPISRSESGINLSEVEFKSKPSFSSQKDLSQLIQGDVSGRSREQNYFKFGKLRKSETNECFL